MRILPITNYQSQNTNYKNQKTSFKMNVKQPKGIVRKLLVRAKTEIINRGGIGEFRSLKELKEIANYLKRALDELSARKDPFVANLVQKTDSHMATRENFLLPSITREGSDGSVAHIPMSLRNDYSAAVESRDTNFKAYNAPIMPRNGETNPVHFIDTARGIVVMLKKIDVSECETGLQKVEQELAARTPDELKELRRLRKMKIDI